MSEGWVRDVAAAAYAKVVARQEAEQMAEDDRDRLRREREEAERERSRVWANAVVNHPSNPLHQWFPDDSFRAFDHKHEAWVVVVPYSEEHSKRPAKDWLFFIIWTHMEAFDTSSGMVIAIDGVGVTERTNDPRDGTSWTNTWYSRGMGLTGPEDVGRFLHEREAARERSASRAR